MQKTAKLLVLLSFLSILGVSDEAQARKKQSWFGDSWFWSKNHDDYVQMKKFNPHLENSRHLQIPQWEHKDWYAEDWLSQRDGMDLVQGFYDADILRDQVKEEDGMSTLLVGPNFYRLSGYDKRRVTHIVDIVYGVTASNENGSFMLKDWNTRIPIGVFDHNGLRLH